MTSAARSPCYSPKAHPANHKGRRSCWPRSSLRRRCSATGGIIRAGSAPRLPRKPSKRAFARQGAATSQSAHDKRLYRQRHKIETMFGRLKDWRRIATRCDRCAYAFFSAICITAAVAFWLGSMSPEPSRMIDASDATLSFSQPKLLPTWIIAADLAIALATPGPLDGMVRAELAQVARRRRLGEARGIPSRPRLHGQCRKLRRRHRRDPRRPRHAELTAAMVEALFLSGRKTTRPEL